MIVRSIYFLFPLGSYGSIKRRTVRYKCFFLFFPLFSFFALPCVPSVESYESRHRA